MSSTVNIRYLKNHEIDRMRWDACIDKADNGLIYGYSFYLDTMCTNWNALVLNDYEAVFALPFRKKWGIYYIYPPFATAQLGLFGNHLTESLLLAFLDKIPNKFRYWVMDLNAKNTLTSHQYPYRLRRNFTLSLARGYHLINSGYSNNVKRNIKKAQLLGCVVKENLALGDILALAKAFTPTIENHATDFKAFENLVGRLQQSGQVKTYGVYSSDEQLLASCVFMFSHNRAYYIFVGNHPEGRKVGASHLLIDTFIKHHADTPLTLDFEGSDVPNVARFYKSFGAIEESYPSIKFNNLPKPIRWLKK